VMLDMDGTLLDKHFDDYFWEVYLPEHYSLLHNISIVEAGRRLMAQYSKVENSLQWADLEYWSRELKLDLPELKSRIDYLIVVHPYVIDFLKFCRSLNKKLYLVTNAHPRTLAIKLGKISISCWFDKLICAQEVGFAKEELLFWTGLQKMLDFNPARSLFADDIEKVLCTADAYGIGRLLHIARSSSRKIPKYSKKYPSIDYFNELMV
ncbi:MAG: haloacid dehalogenase, partial [Candidatus Electrothrix sp. AR3]|nr:haloacid dehalogenase [Candidatus Electrothrix sp. AR3]